MPDSAAPPRVVAAGLTRTWNIRRAEVEAAIEATDRLSQALAGHALTPAEEPMPTHAAPMTPAGGPAR
jgi:hypothetical protein